MFSFVAVAKDMVAVAEKMIEVETVYNSSSHTDQRSHAYATSEEEPLRIIRSTSELHTRQGKFGSSHT